MKNILHHLPHFVLRLSARPFCDHVATSVGTHLSSTPVWRRGRSWPHQEGPLPRWDTTPALHSPSSSVRREGGIVDHLSAINSWIHLKHNITSSFSDWAHVLLFSKRFSAAVGNRSSSGVEKVKCFALETLHSSFWERSYSIPLHIFSIGSKDHIMFSTPSRSLTCSLKGLSPSTDWVQAR